MSWLFSQVLVEEFSVASCLGGQPSVQLNVMPTQHKFWRNDKTIDASDHSLFGLTLRVLTEDHGQELLMSYRAAFRARISARRERALDSMASEADFGPKWRGSFARFNLDTSTWKTPQCSLLGGSEEFSETWPVWGSMRNGECWALTTPMLRTREKESGFLPTPDASMGARGASTNKTNRRPDGSKRQVTINDIVGGRPNPTWTEWVMGWPIGWTDLKPLETDRFQEWRQQHGIF